MNDVSAPAPMAIAIYDMDKTITRRPTYAPFLFHAAAAHGPVRLLLAPFVLLTIFLYAVRLIGRARLKEISHALLLGDRLSGAAAARLAASFADRVVADGLLPGAVAQIAADRAAGCRIVLATASYAFYARAIAARLGIDDIVATGVVTDADGTLRARIAGENCYGAAKRRMVEVWLAAEGLRREDCFIRFYSDHVSDAPMFEFADEAVAVNAHPPLRALALARGWPLVDWR